MIYKINIVCFLVLVRLLLVGDQLVDLLLMYGLIMLEIDLYIKMLLGFLILGYF